MRCALPASRLRRRERRLSGCSFTVSHAGFPSARTDGRTDRGFRDRAGYPPGCPAPTAPRQTRTALTSLSLPAFLSPCCQPLTPAPFRNGAPDPAEPPQRSPASPHCQPGRPPRGPLVTGTAPPSREGPPPGAPYRLGPPGGDPRCPPPAPYRPPLTVTAAHARRPARVAGRRRGRVTSGRWADRAPSGGGRSGRGAGAGDRAGGAGPRPRRPPQPPPLRAPGRPPAPRSSAAAPSLAAGLGARCREWGTPVPFPTPLP